MAAATSTNHNLSVPAVDDSHQSHHWKLPMAAATSTNHNLSVPAVGDSDHQSHKLKATDGGQHFYKS